MIENFSIKNDILEIKMMCFSFLIYFSIAYYFNIKILLIYTQNHEHQKAIEITIIINRFKDSKIIINLNVVYDNSE